MRSCSAVCDKSLAKIVNGLPGSCSSEEHKLRMAGLPARLRIPRSSWASHPNYKGRFQMPNFHHDFRQYMQAIIALLVDAADPSLNVIAQLSRDVHERRQRSPQEAQPASSAAEQASGAVTTQERVERAAALWRDFKSKLNRHVGIEESAIFPAIAAHYPGLDLQFLYSDHEELLDLEVSVARALREADATADQQAIETALEKVVEFDEQFVTHLGEEEEFVVPLCLLTQQCLLHGPRPSNSRRN